MDSFNLPLSRQLDFGVDENGHAFFKSWDGRGSLHLTPDEFAAMFELLRDNAEKFSRELNELEKSKED